MREKHPLQKVLPIRLTDTMLNEIQVMAKNLNIRPHDIARVSIGIGLNFLSEHKNLLTQKLIDKYS